MNTQKELERTQEIIKAIADLEEKIKRLQQDNLVKLVTIGVKLGQL